MTSRLQHHWITGLAALVLPAAALAVETGGAILLRDRCEVDGSGVYLTDLLGENSTVVVPSLFLMESPLWGAEREITQEELGQLLMGTSIANRITFPAGTDKLHITRRGRLLEGQEVLRMMKEELSRSTYYQGGQLDLQMVRPWKSVLVPDDPLTMSLTTPPTSRSSQFALRFQLQDGERKIGRWTTYLKAQLWKEVWVATRNVRRGTLVPDAGLTRERIDVTTVRQPLWDGNPDDSRFELAESISPGRLVYDRAVSMRPVVRRGRIAKAVVFHGALYASIKVRVMDDGAPGDVVRVQNPLTRKELRGQVIDENTIRISVF